jgi:hypothetical protein
MEAIAQVYEPADAADFLLRVVEGGPVAGRTVQAGMALALVADRSDLVRALAPNAPDLDPDVLDRLLQRAAERGQTEAAGILARELLQAG